MSNDSKASSNVFTLFNTQKVDLTQLQTELSQAVQTLEHKLKASAQPSVSRLNQGLNSLHSVTPLPRNTNQTKTSNKTSQSPLQFFHHTTSRNTNAVQQSNKVTPIKPKL